MNTSTPILITPEWALLLGLDDGKGTRNNDTAMENSISTNVIYYQIFMQLIIWFLFDY